MKKNIIALAAALLPLMAAAQSNTDRLHISGMSVNKGDSLITLNMTLDPKDFHIKRNDIVSIRPKLVAGSDTIDMPPVRVAGKGAWYSEIREGSATPLTLSRAGKDAPVEYSATVPFDSRFNSSAIVVQADTASICNCEPPRSSTVPVAELDFEPENPTFAYDYLEPKAAADKVYDLSGRANIIFKVNRTDIDWSYFSNKAELDTILRTINVVKDNPDATVERILLTGYASPEGPYANNVRLAKGRTEAVRKYVEDNSGFPHSIYATASVPEDWDGLREWLAASSMPNRGEMIAFIDDESVPIEKKNDMFRAKFPADYPYLLKNVYPLLRHTDYKITYNVRRYYDVDEIERVLATNPANLSLNEIILLAGKYKPGSPEYDQVYLTAARLFPDSDVANLNAANSAMNMGDLQSAARFLERAGDSSEADYARAILLAKEGDYAKALQTLDRAIAAGSTAAPVLKAQIERMMTPRESIRIL